MNATHKLKTWPEPFRAILDGRKRHEFRRDSDRIFMEGDTLVLQEFDPCVDCKATGHMPEKTYMRCNSCRGEKGKYTLRELRCEATYISRHPDYGMPQGFVAMTIRVDGEGVE